MNFYHTGVAVLDANDHGYFYHEVTLTTLCNATLAGAIYAKITMPYIIAQTEFHGAQCTSREELHGIYQGIYL